MKKIELNIIALANSESSEGNFALILEEQAGFRRLPIIIGPFEAQAIAISLERMQPKRPLTHDLFKNTLELLGAQITEILISDLVEGVFFDTLYGTQSDDSPLQVAARSSAARLFGRSWFGSGLSSALTSSRLNRSHIAAPGLSRHRSACRRT